MIRVTWTSILFCLVAICDVHAESAPSANRKGIDAYNKGEYDASVEHFTDALVQEPESALIRFNLGTALAADERPKEAVSQLNQSASGADDPSLAASAWFNAGNILLRSNELDAAIAHYQKALKLDQSSPDIRHNLELAVRMKDQQQQQNEQQNQDQNQQQDEQQQQNQDQQQQDQQQDQQDQQDQQQEQQPDQSNDGQNQQEQLSERDPDKRDTPMSMDEAERILDAMEQEEREALEMKNEKIDSGIQQGNDW